MKRVIALLLSMAMFHMASVDLPATQTTDRRNALDAAMIAAGAEVHPYPLLQSADRLHALPGREAASLLAELPPLAWTMAGDALLRPKMARRERAP